MKFLMIIAVLTQILFAQSPDTLWTKKYYEGKNIKGYSSYECTDKTIIVTGHYYSKDPYKLFIYKTDSSGNLIWKKYFGGNKTVVGNKIIQTTNNSYLSIGDVPYENNRDIWVINVNEAGDSLWSLQIGTDRSEFSNDVKICSDKNYLILGTSESVDYDSSYIFLSKVSENGELIWAKTIKDSLSIYPEAIDNTTDGNFIIISRKITKRHYPYSKILLTKIDEEGNIIWEEEYGTNDLRLYPKDIISTKDNGYAIVGTDIKWIVETGSQDGYIMILKTDDKGKEEWTKNYGENVDVHGNSIIEHEFGFSVHGIEQNSVDSNQDSWIIRLSPEGDSMWTTRFGDEMTDHFRSMIQLSDKSLFLTGHYYDRSVEVSSLYLIKFDIEKVNAQFGSNIVPYSLPLVITFFDSSSQNSNVPITNYSWDFQNDGVIDSHEKNPTFTYFNEDSFSVNLVVSNGYLTDTMTKEKYITTYFETAPNLYSIKDITNDQGGWVKVQFARSALDTDSLIFPKLNSPEYYTIEIDDGTGWTAAASTLAYGKSLYSVLVPTTKDSTSVSDGLIYFRVIAGLEEDNYVSKIDSGYSVDNLKPSVPDGLFASLIAESKVRLKWLPNSETDFKYYKIYKNINSQFENIHQTTDTVFADFDVQIGNSYSYAITATDHSGNESSLSEMVDITVTSLEKNSKIPVEYYLGQNYPNPFNPETTIKFGMKRSGNVKIVIYDVLGNKVKELINGFQNAGHHQIIWSGENNKNELVCSGVFFYQIITNDFKQHKKMLILK